MTNTVDNVNQLTQRLGEEIAEEIHAIRHLFIQRRYRGQHVGGHELSHMEARVIFFLGNRAGATQSEIVVHLGRDKGQIARLIAGLRDAGLIEARTDEIDRRVQRLYLTDSGSKILRRAKRERRRLLGKAVSNFEAAEREMLLHLLARMRANLELE